MSGLSWIAALLHPSVGMFHGVRTLLGGDPHVLLRDLVHVGVQGSQRVDEVALIRSAVLVGPVYSPPLDLEHRCPRRVKGLAVMPGEHRVEALHRTARPVGIVVGERRPQLVCAQDQPGADERIRPRQPERMTGEQD